MELLVLLFDQMHRFTVGNPPEGGTNYRSAEIPKTYVKGDYLITGLERCIRVHVPVIPTVARPKNIIGSRPYKLSDQRWVIRGSRMEYHDGRCEIDGLRREICDGSLES